MRKSDAHLRFWSKVDWSGDCWIWTAGKNSDGYGSITTAGNQKALAHRLAYEWARGPIPEGLELDHLCRVLACVNPDHLEAVTHQENMRRGTWGARTHCRQGHPYDEANTYVNRGKRFCRACHLANQRARTAAQRKVEA